METELNVKNGNHLVVNCPLCGENGLHIIEAEASVETRQCLNCGYVTAPKFKLMGGSRETVEVGLTEDMKKWAKVEDDYLWIPTIMTLPFGMLYPFADENDTMKWGYSEMVDIPEEEQKDYPIPGQEGKFYSSRYDTDNQTVFETFLEGMSLVNKIVKEKTKNG